jgi:hypothetical protein
VTPDAVDRLTPTIRQNLNSLPNVQWSWLLPLFDVNILKSKSNLLAKAWRAVLAGSVCGVRFGRGARNALVRSVGAVVLPSMKQGCHYCCIAFTDRELVASFCSCKNGLAVINDDFAAHVDAQSVAKCRHVLSACIILGLAQENLVDDMEGACKWFMREIAKKRQLLDVRFVSTRECVWPPRVQCLSMGLEDAQAVAREARGMVALHPELRDGGWDAMLRDVQVVRREIDATKQTMGSLPFYALTHGPKKPKLMQLAAQCGIVPPARVSKGSGMADCAAEGRKGGR